MSTPAPRLRVRWLLASVLDGDTLSQVVDPTLADLQYELLSAGSRWQRWTILIRGYSGVVRVLFACAWRARLGFGRMGAILALGVGGAALANWARVSGMDGKLGNSGLVLPMLASPILFRAFDPEGSYGQRFLTSVAVGTIACVGLDVAASIGRPAHVAWHLVWLVIATGLIVVSSALGAAAVWSPFQSRAPLLRKVLAGVFYSSAIVTFGFLLRNRLSAVGQPLDLLRTPFYVVFFGGLLAATVLPLLLLVRRWIRTTSALILIALACAPAPMIAGAVIEGQSLPQAIIDCLHWSLPVLISALPFIAGTMALGWIVGSCEEPLIQR